MLLRGLTIRLFYEGGEWQGEPEGRAFAWRAFDANIALELFDDGFTDAEAELSV